MNGVRYASPGVHMLEPLCKDWIPGGSCQPLEYLAFGFVVAYASWRTWTRGDSDSGNQTMSVFMHTIGLIGMLLVIVLSLWGEGWLHGQLRLISHGF
jgi:tetrahydromethanopterin S-methyltransferase subunit E